MGLAVGKVGKAANGSQGTIAVSWTGGGSNTAGSDLVGWYMGVNQNGSAPAAPAGWTRLLTISNNGGTGALYYILNASAVSSITFNTNTDDAYAVDIAEITGASISAIDSNSTVASGNGTTATTNGITTVSANAIVLAFFSGRSSTTTPRTLSTPGSGFTQLQTNNQSVGAAFCMTTYGTEEIFSSTQSGLTTTCAINTSANWNAVSMAFAQASDPSVLPFPHPPMPPAYQQPTRVVAYCKRLILPPAWLSASPRLRLA